MLDLETWLLALTLAGFFLGSSGILLARICHCPLRCACGRGLFLATLLFLGGTSLFAAFHHADGLILLGLTAGALVILMLWEAPGQAGHYVEALSSVEKH